MTTAPALYDQLKLFSLLIQKRAITDTYRVLALAPDHVRAAGLFGLMRAECNLGLKAEVCVDANAFLQVLRSLPDAEFTVEAAEGTLRWVCGPAKGHLAIAGSIAVPAPEGAGRPAAPVTAAFGEGLELGALACGSQAMRTLNLLGVQINCTEGDTVAYATDNASLSSCDLETVLDPGTITLLPDAVTLLAALIQRDGSAMIGFDASSLTCATANAFLLLHQYPPLRTDLAEIAGRFTKAEMAMPLLHESVQAFLRRAEALTEERAIVEVAVEDGRMALAFRSAGSSTEEFIITKGPKVTVPAIKVEAHRMARALRHADKMIFDYAASNVLILRGPQRFMFAINGRREGANERGTEGRTAGNGGH